MTFLNALLLPGIAALAIPLIIHLLRKRKVQEVHWGANFLLHESRSSRRRAPQWHRWLLLLIRILIPLILALCLARPALRAIMGGGKGDPGSHVIVLDTSPSMLPSLASPTGINSTGSDHPALKAISEVIDGLPKGSQVTVIGGDGGDPLGVGTLSGDLNRITRAIRANRLQPGGRFDPAIAARRAGEVLAGAAHPSRSVLVISDFQSTDWDRGAGRSLRTLAQADGDLAPTVRFLQVELPATKKTVGISEASTSGLTAVTGEPVSFRARVFNPTGQPWEGHLVAEVDGAELVRRPVSVGSKMSREVAMVGEFPEAGYLGVDLRLEPDPGGWGASVPVVLPVRKPIPVMLVDGRPGYRPLEGDTGYLDLALQPFASASDGKGEGDLFRSSVSRDTNNLNANHLMQFEVVVLANCDELRASNITDLRKWVNEGGGLVVFPGDRTKASFYNAHLLGPKTGIFPATIGDLIKADPSTGGIVHPDAPPYAHPVLAYFNGLGGTGLETFGFSRYLRLEPSGDPADPASPRAILRFQDGDPLFVEAQVGAGKILMAAVPADADWGSWPTQPAYLPFVQRLVAYMSQSASSSLEVELGESFHFPLPDAQNGDRVVLLDPTGHQATLKIEGPAMRTNTSPPPVLHTPPCKVPGIYTVRPAAGGDPIVAFSCRIPAGEIGDRPLDADQLQALAVDAKATRMDSVSTVLESDTLARIGREIWRPLAWLVLALLFLELLVAQSGFGAPPKPKKGGAKS